MLSHDIEPQQHESSGLATQRPLGPTVVCHMTKTVRTQRACSASTRRGRGTFTLRVLAVMLVISWWLAVPLAAEDPQLTAIFPLSCRAGESVRVSLTGKHLDTSSALVFDNPAITAEREPSGQFVIRVAAGAQPLECDVWCLAGSRLSNPRRFVISTLQRQTEDQDNDTADAAQSLPLPSSIDGRLETKAERDWYQFSGKSGQQIAIRCRSRSLDGAVAPVLVLYDASGRELAHSSGRRLEPLLLWTVPQDGVYRLRVSDRSYQAGPASYYRLELFSGTHALSAFPNLLQIAVPAKLALYGIGLTDHAPQTARFAGGQPVPTQALGTIPGVGHDAPLAWQHAGEVFPRVQLGHSPLLASMSAPWPSVALTAEPVIAEVETQTSSQQDCQPLVVPSLVNGRFDRRGDVDWYALTVAKGTSLRIDLYGDRFGLRTDLDASLLDDTGKTLITFPDLGDSKGALAKVSSGSLDVSAVWKAPADGSYRLVIRDLYGSSVAGVDRSYVLHVRPDAPGFRVTALPPSDTLPGGFSVPQSGRTGWRMSAMRFGGFKGPIHITLNPENPPPGLALDDCWIGPGQTDTTCVLSADAEANLGVRFFNFEAQATIDNQPRRQPVTVTTLTDSHNTAARRVHRTAAAIANPSRLGLGLENKSKSVAAGGTLQLLLRRTHLRGTLKGPVKISLTESPLTAAKPIPDLAPQATSVNFAVQVPQKLPPGPYSIAARASATFVIPAAKGQKPTEETLQVWSNSVVVHVVAAAKAD